MNRVPLVVANWKMNLTASQAAVFANRLAPLLAPHATDIDAGRLDVAIAPAFPALDRLRHALGGSPVALAAQDVHEAAEGAYTGEVSLAMLEDLGCRYVLVGHSERRQLFGESDERVAAKLAAVLESSICPILCVGETLAEREAGRVEAVLERQLAGPIERFAQRTAARATAPPPALVVAYEPVWAIGTGRVATPATAQAAHATIRHRLEGALGPRGSAIRILYGGSVKPDNARSLIEQPDIDGALVGGASLDPEHFASIVSTCRETQLEP
ncbi:MAG: triose-phosphate isomerase [Myxococcota bacterium]